ncbi:MAG: deoxyribonuclease IV [Nitrososphaerota archaeon]|nr:deoxyribonuclease IV [Nitrososphaerota archaeon]MDG6922981.1 deoxyribonuclease IV [Nitrososphaerota archaeon]
MKETLGNIRDRAVGIHVSISGKLDLSVERAIEAGCVGAFQIFTCSPRQWKASKLKPIEVDFFKSKVKQNNFQVFAHMPYLPNLSSPEESFYRKSVDVLKREIDRCDSLGVRFLVLHFGSHLGTSIEAGQKRIIGACNEAIRDSPMSQVRMLLENSAGVKNSVGSEFPLIRKVLDAIHDRRRVGVCFDTCHAFAANYDMRTIEAVQETVAELETNVGLENLHLIHLNDSKGGIGDSLDRHEHIGEGNIGVEGMSAILNLKELSHLPFVLETPMDEDGDDKRDIETVKKLIKT